jgi:hypothetical protein
MRTQIRRLIPALSARLREEAGMSLVLALGFMTIFSLTTAAIVNELVLNDTGARRDQKMVSALASAEAEMNFASQWVLKNDFNDTLAVGTTYPHSTDAPSSILSGSTYYYTGNGVAGATNTGWWARKLDNSTTSPTCTEVLYSFFHSLPATTKCWQVDGRATIGQSTREVRMLLTTNDVQTTTIFTPTYTPTTNLVPTTGQQVTTVTVTSTNTVNDYGSWGFGTFSSGQATGSCYTISGNGGISEPVYTPGNLCIAGNGFIHQNTSGNVTLYVKGTLSTSSNSFAGTSTSKLTSATVGACTSGGSAVICSSGASSHLYANTYFSSGGTINKPTVSLASVYASADPGPNHPCSVAAGSTASSTWPTFDTNTTRDNSVASTASPFTSTSYTCKTATGGNISWNATTHVFTITGTVFIDGNLNFSSQTVVYSGRGNIYYNGTVSMSGNGTSYICPAANCPTDGSWNMATNLLLMGAGNQGSIPTTCGYSWSMTGNAILQGAGWANGCIQEAGNGGIEGPAVADGYSISGNGTYYQPLGSNTLPPGAPVNSSTTLTTTLSTSTANYTTTGQSVSTITDTTTTPNNYWGQLATSWQQLS